MTARTINIKDHINSCNSERVFRTREVERIESLLDRNNVTQIIFSFGIRPVHCLLDYFEAEQEYEMCARILRKIKTHNKNVNKEYKTHL